MLEDVRSYGRWVSIEATLSQDAWGCNTRAFWSRC
jgi:hypothetical protein